MDIEPSREELLEWLKEVADPDCPQCNGCGIFYGNVHICGCVGTTEKWFPIDQAPARKTVLLGCSGTRYTITAYLPSPKAGWRHAHSSDPICFEPTHFQYLPQPPIKRE